MDDLLDLEPDECRTCYGMGFVLEEGCRCPACNNIGCPDCGGSGRRSDV